MSRPKNLENMTIPELEAFELQISIAKIRAADETRKNLREYISRIARSNGFTVKELSR